MKFQKENICYWPIIKAIPDRVYLKLHFLLTCKRRLDLKHPKGFNEKLQWLKLYDRNPRYTSLVDKIEAKEIVASLIGKEHIIPTIGVWNRFDEIDFDTLPDRFVIKCSHDSGGLVICRDKSQFDKEKARQIIEASLGREFFYLGREWPYKNVKPRILAEKFMSEVDLSGEYRERSTVELGLTDYKFYCFHGEPKFLYISKGLEDHSTALMDFLYPDWTSAEFQRTDFARFESLPEKPQHFDQMMEYASILSKDIPFVRVDFYEISGVIYFSEMTFSPSSGFALFKPDKWENVIGEWIHI